MTPSKPNAADALALAAACHRRFLDYIATQSERETTLQAETARDTPDNAAKLAMHAKALETLASAAKEFGSAPTAATPSYTQFLQEIKRLLDLRCWARLTALSTASNGVIALAPGSAEFTNWTISLGIETGHAQATQDMYNTFIMLVEPYFHHLQGA